MERHAHQERARRDDQEVARRWGKFFLARGVGRVQRSSDATSFDDDEGPVARRVVRYVALTPPVRVGAAGADDEQAPDRETRSR